LARKEIPAFLNNNRQISPEILSLCPENPFYSTII
jgi:hypothetical protein